MPTVIVILKGRDFHLPKATDPLASIVSAFAPQGPDLLTFTWFHLSATILLLRQQTKAIIVYG